MYGEDRTVRPLEEDIESLGLDPNKIIGDMDRNCKLVEEWSTAPLGGEGVREDPLQEDCGCGDIYQEVGSDSAPSDVYEEVDDDDEDIDGEPETMDEALKRRKKGYRMDASGKMVKVSKQQLRKEKAARRKKRGALKAASRLYRKRFKSKIAKRRKMRKGKTKKGFIVRQESVNIQASDRLSQLKEDLESTSTNTGDVSEYEDAALNAGYLAHLLGECFEAIGDQSIADMLYTMSDTGATISEEIEANGGELSESIEEKLNGLLEGVSKAMAAHEDLGQPSLHESIGMGIENGLLEDVDDDEDDEFLDEDEDIDDDTQIDEDEDIDDGDDEDFSGINFFDDDGE